MARREQLARVVALVERSERLALFDVSQAANLAERALEVVDSIEDPPLDVIARALGARATAASLAGRHAAALEAYQRALRSEVLFPRQQLAETLRRFAVALRRAGEHDRALEVVNRAIEAHLKLRSGLGLGLVIRAYIHFDRADYSQASADFAAALPELSPKTSPRHYLAALGGLGVCAVRTSNPADVAGLLRKLRKARRRAGLPLWSVPGAHFQWVEGLLMRRLGSTRTAESSLLRAREILAELGSPRDLVLLTLDLADLLLEEGRRTEARDLLGEALAVSQLWRDRPDARLAALRAFVADAEIEAEAEVLRLAREALAGRLSRAEP